MRHSESVKRVWTDDDPYWSGPTGGSPVINRDAKELAINVMSSVPPGRQPQRARQVVKPTRRRRTSVGSRRAWTVSVFQDKTYRVFYVDDAVDPPGQEPWAVPGTQEATMSGIGEGGRSCAKRTEPLGGSHSRSDREDRHGFPAGDYPDGGAEDILHMPREDDTISSQFCTTLDGETCERRLLFTLASLREAVGAPTRERISILKPSCSAKTRCRPKLIGA